MAIDIEREKLVRIARSHRRYWEDTEAFHRERENELILAVADATIDVLRYDRLIAGIVRLCLTGK